MKTRAFPVTKQRLIALLKWIINNNKNPIWAKKKTKKKTAGGNSWKARRKSSKVHKRKQKEEENFKQPKKKKTSIITNPTFLKVLSDSFKSSLSPQQELMWQQYLCALKHFGRSKVNTDLRMHACMHVCARAPPYTPAEQWLVCVKIRFPSCLFF